MGIIRHGILGGFRKKVGTVVGAFFRDLNVIRALPRISNKPATKVQATQRSSFGLVTGFLSSFSDFIELFYGNRSASKSPMNEAVSYHLKEAVTTVGSVLEMDYTKVMFARGKLKLPAEMNLAATVEGKVDFEWSTNADSDDNKYRAATDMANLLVYNPAKGEFVSLMGAAPRSAGVFKLQLPPEFGEDYVHGYINFSSIDKKGLVSNSKYVGKIMIVAMT
ncbi:hypothetical protein FBD94_05035 [Pedobacter hiemivivus]|uniref:Uncharacterized protein n=1 Tax=Pedobacter hiemivivus TaxID=2530454 RepID=A0A4R0NI36_9SPHI|nr:DUF6266 family protein [Pedobacter hiemivivus]TCC99437.1 hypothetical protein EZ444_01810 [Pedobacter hiemivivus]TKC63714.1 hypothetical protein FBD94_05035 [Pedobacter hiemivivus]